MLPTREEFHLVGDGCDLSLSKLTMDNNGYMYTDESDIDPWIHPQCV